MLIKTFPYFFCILTYFFHDAILSYSLYEYKLYQIILGGKTDIFLRCVLLVCLESKKKTWKFKKRKTVLYYDNIHNMVQKYPYLYIYIYFSIRREISLFTSKVNKNDYTRCVTVWLVRGHGQTARVS